MKLSSLKLPELEAEESGNGLIQWMARVDGQYRETAENVQDVVTIINEVKEELARAITETRADLGTGFFLLGTDSQSERSAIVNVLEEQQKKTDNYRKHLQSTLITINDNAAYL